MNRNGLSGARTGLLRVRMWSMNDAHSYGARDQGAQEFADNIRMVQDYYAAFGFENYHFQLSLWDPEAPDKYIDQPENWAATENHLRQLLDGLGVPYVETIGEAAFYLSLIHI